MTEQAWKGKGWALTVTPDAVRFTGPDGVVDVEGHEALALRVRRRWFRWQLERNGSRLGRLPGLDAAGARKAGLAIKRAAVARNVAAAVSWQTKVTSLLADERRRQRWIPQEAVNEILRTRPPPGLLGRLQAVGAAETLTDSERDAVALLDADLEADVAKVNEEIMAAELSARRKFFDRIEKSPLSEEQARAVVCFDNRVQVLAAAGSGKTSVMVARAAYAVDRGFVAPDRILLLAFNNAAAEELRQRITARFAAAGIDATGVRASTFHAFGLDVIGQATGEKPRLAPWVEHGRDTDTIVEIVDELSDGSATFRRNWDLYRLLFAHAPTDLTVDEPDGWNGTKKEGGYQTFGGDVVKSHGERLIADFLYLNGIEYVYERPFDVNVATATKVQYRPDFYYPAKNVWHEHWAVAADGKPPASFVGYAEQMAWKRKLHQTHGSKFVESTFADVVFRDGLTKLEKDLRSFGIEFDWNPDRPPRNQWSKPMKHDDLARFVRTFMTHVKSNGWTQADLEARLAKELPHLNGYRTRLFLSVYWPIHDAWQRRLQDQGVVDFEDMLVQAADHLETDRASFPYELIMVDEFQDASRARGRFIRGLVKRPNRYLLAVGDDWQSINRFAGADLTVMTDFETWFGKGPQLALTTTYRCPQTICDTARKFVSKNPAQFNKPMRSVQPQPGRQVTVIRSSNTSQALDDYLRGLAAGVAGGTVTPGSDGTVSVLVLVRYNFQREALARRPGLRVETMTIHKSKGLEADYVVIPSMSAGTYGFPSTITDDPVLGAAMPTPETFERAEERRLFYVALTRARREVTLIAPPERMSPFVAELIKDKQVAVAGGTSEPIKVCSTCGQGTIVKKNGKYGPFFGCSRWPACNGKS